MGRDPRDSQDTLVKLNEYINSERLRRMSGDVEPNCVSFTAEGIVAMGGKHPAKSYIKPTFEASFRAVKKAGYSGIVQFLEKKYEEIDPPTLAQIGDVAVITADSGNAAVGLVCGPYIAVLTPEGTVGMLPLTRAERVFRW